MSSFGYGKTGSYKVTPDNDFAPNPQQPGAFSQPQQPYNMPRSPMDFTPQAQQPWETEYFNADLQTGSGMNNYINSGWKKRKLWENPLETNFGDWTSASAAFLREQQQQRGYDLPYYSNDGGWGAKSNQSWRNLGYSSGAGSADFFNNPLATTPVTGEGKISADMPSITSFDSIKNAIMNASDEDLIKMDYGGNYINRFKNAAQDWQNAFANQDFAADAKRISPDLNADNVGSWLEDSYNTLVKRLGDRGLL